MAESMEGRKVPDIRLAASNGQEVSLTDFKGKTVVLYFYPKDMTPGCTQEACDFRDHNDQLSKRGVQVIGVSPDEMKSHHKFIEKHQLPFLLLSDPDHQLADYFKVWVKKKMYGKEYMGIERSTFLIDQEGTIIKEWRKVKVDGHVQDVIKTLESLAH